jgi:hemerythrin-like metal-binding protein
MALIWNDAYSFGHLKVDDARKNIFNLANEFAAKKDIVIARTALTYLADYSRHYFPVEEQLIFAASGEKAYKLHAHEHRILIQHVEKQLLTGLHDKGDPTKDFVTKSAAILEMWIFNHFMKTDPTVRPDLLKAAQKVADKRMGAS